MGVIRQIVEGSVTDFEKFSALAKQACALVEERLPGTLHYECFTDPASGRFLWEESYRDASAWLEHLQQLTEAGISQEFAEILGAFQVTVLTPVEDPQVRQVLDEWGAVELSPFVGATR